jgi:hypothetical protein
MYIYASCGHYLSENVTGHCESLAIYLNFTTQKTNIDKDRLRDV